MKITTVPTSYSCRELNELIVVKWLNSVWHIIYTRCTCVDTRMHIVWLIKKTLSCTEVFRGRLFHAKWPQAVLSEGDPRIGMLWLLPPSVCQPSALLRAERLSLVSSADLFYLLHEVSPGQRSWVTSPPENRGMHWAVLPGAQPPWGHRPSTVLGSDHSGDPHWATCWRVREENVTGPDCRALCSNMENWTHIKHVNKMLETYQVTPSTYPQLMWLRSRPANGCSVFGWKGEAGLMSFHGGFIRKGKRTVLVCIWMHAVVWHWANYWALVSWG